MTKFSYVAPTAIAGSIILLAAALGFQYMAGLAPCQLCIWQRWPHVAAIAIGAAAIAFRRRELAWLAGVSLVVGTAIAMYHVGVEQDIWPGPAGCSGGSLESLTAAQLLDMTAPPGVVACDVIAWQFSGLSMAAWNGLLSLALALLWIQAARNLRTG